MESNNYLLKRHVSVLENTIPVLGTSEVIMSRYELKKKLGKEPNDKKVHKNNWFRVYCSNVTKAPVYWKKA